MRARIMTLLLCFVLLTGCSPAATPPAPSGRDADGNWIFDKTVTVGRVVPLSGPLASFGAGTPYVELAAIRAINEQGGILLDGQRCRLKLEYADSQSSAKQAAEAAQALINQGIDIMIVSNTSDTVSPVSAVCEQAGIACISTDAPASAWIMGGPYQNCWHTHFDNEHELLCFWDAWDRVDTNKTIGLITANDSEGMEIATFIQDFATYKGYTIVDPGRYIAGLNDYTPFADAFAAAQCDIIVGVMNPEDFAAFWRQCMASDYRPKMCTVAKACLFASDVEQLGPLANGLISEVWWNADFPTVSSITGQTSAQLAQDYLQHYDPTLRVVPPTVGYKHANVEILYDILRRAGSLDLDAINAAANQTDLNTVIGHVRFNDDHVSVMSCLAGQWVCNPDGSYRQEIVGNYLIPTMDITADIILISEEEEK